MASGRLRIGHSTQVFSLIAEYGQYSMTGQIAVLTKSGSAYPTIADFYVSSTASGSGDGSVGNPWTPAQALSIATASTMVGRHTYIRWLAGSGGLYTRTAPTSHNTPAFAPANSGRSSTEKIIHYAEFAGVHLSSPTTNVNRTELAHTGTGDGLSGTDASHIGFSAVSNVEFQGFVFNDDNGTFEIDGGAVLAERASGSCSDCAVRFCYIQGNVRAGDDFSNYSALWLEGVDNFAWTDNHVLDFRYAGNDGHNTAGLTLYGANNILIENNIFDNVYNAIFSKGTHPSGTGFNSGIVRRNIIRNGVQGMNFNDVAAAGIWAVYQNLMYNMGEAGIVYGNVSGSGGAQNCRNVHAYNNTIHCNGASNVAGFGSEESPNLKLGNRVYDNVVVVEAASFRHGLDVSSSTIPWDSLHNNLYYFAGGNQRWQWNSVVSTSLAGWQSALQSGGSPVNSRDENSQVGNPLFDANYLPQAGSPALTMGSSSGLGGVGGQIGHGAGNPVMGPRQ